MEIQEIFLTLRNIFLKFKGNEVKKNKEKHASLVGIQKHFVENYKCNLAVILKS